MPIVGSFAGASARAYGAGAGGVLIGDFESIASTTVGAGGTSTITFSSISQTFTHLQVRGISNTTTAQNASIIMRFNSDATNGNYRDHYLFGSGASAGAGTNGNYPYLGLQGTGNASAFAPSVVDILDYANTNKYKTVRSLNGNDSNGAGYCWFSSMLWMNTNAITSIDIVANGANFTQYSQFALYGVKA